MQFSEGIAQRLVLVGQHGENPGEDHGLDGFEAGKGGRGARGFSDRVAHASVGDPLDIGDDEADVAGFQFFQSNRLRRQRAQLFHFINFVSGHQPDFHVLCDAAFHHTHQHHRAAIDVKP